MNITFTTDTYKQTDRVTNRDASHLKKWYMMKLYPVFSTEPMYLNKV